MFFKIVSDLSGAEAKPKIVPEKKGEKNRRHNSRLAIGQIRRYHHIYFS
jgi:hypothetical protein